MDFYYIQSFIDRIGISGLLLFNKNSGKIKRSLMKKVVDYYKYRYYKAHGDTTVLKLECGHEKSQKGGIAIPKKAKCPICEGIG